MSIMLKIRRDIKDGREDDFRENRRKLCSVDRPPIVVAPTVLVQRPPEAWGEGR